MKIFQTLLLFLGVLYTMCSQNKVAQISGEFQELDQAFNIHDEENGNFVLFLEEGDTFYSVLFNSDFTEIARAKAPDLASKFKAIVGYKIEGKKVDLFMNTLNGRSYGVYHLNFETGEGSSKELDFKVRKEQLIHTFQHKNNPNLLTVPKGSSTINLYNFKDTKNPSLKTIEFKKDDFLDYRDRPINFFELIDEAEMSSVAVGAPNSIEVTSKKFKVYKNAEKIILTSDKFIEFTYVITINLETYEYKVQRINKPTIEGFRMSQRNNSFILDNNLFQFIANNDDLKFQIINLDNEEIIKSITLTDDDEITFKNTPIILLGGDFKAYRELETTNQFLRKISEGDVGLSVFKNGEDYQITMGSTAEKENPYMLMGGALFGVAGVIIASNINSLTTSYNLYKNTKSVRITGLFNKDFNHIEGKVPPNVFDKIEKRAKALRETSAQTIFKYNSSYILGYFDINEKTYNLLQFLILS